MAVMEAVKVVPALREAAVLEPFAAIMALYESTTIAALETTTSWSRAIKVAACIRSGTAIGAAGEVAATARHCAGMATTTAPPTTNTAATATAEGSMASAAPAPTAAVATATTATAEGSTAATAAAVATAMYEDDGAVMDGTYSDL
jgi:hypothetical protein